MAVQTLNEREARSLTDGHVHHARQALRSQRPVPPRRIRRLPALGSTHRDSGQAPRPRPWFLSPDQPCRSTQSRSRQLKGRSRRRRPDRTRLRLDCADRRRGRRQGHRDAHAGMEERRQYGQAVAGIVSRLCNAEGWRLSCERYHVRGGDKHPVGDLVHKAGHRKEGARTHWLGHEVVDREWLSRRQPRGRRGWSRAAEEWSAPGALPGAPSWRSGGRAGQGTRERRVPGDRACIRVPGVDGLPFGGRARRDVGRDRRRERGVGDSGGAD